MLRTHSQYIDRFLRVQFVDDDGDFPVTGETLIIDDEVQGTEGVFARIRRAFSYGIFIAGRHYVFATFSESQGRCVIQYDLAHGIWLNKMVLFTDNEVAG